MYRCEARSVEGFVPQLAVSYVRNGYFFYVPGPSRKGRTRKRRTRESFKNMTSRYQNGPAYAANVRAARMCNTFGSADSLFCLPRKGSIVSLGRRATSETSGDFRSGF